MEILIAIVALLSLTIFVFKIWNLKKEPKEQLPDSKGPEELDLEEEIAEIDQDISGSDLKNKIDKLE